MKNFTTEDFIKELKKKSKELFDQKKFFESGRINMAIDVLEQELQELKKQS